jgi:hypothetical protein
VAAIQRMTRCSFVPLTIEILDHDPELDDEVGREVFRPDLAPLFLPEADSGPFRPGPCGDMVVVLLI